MEITLMQATSKNLRRVSVCHMGLSEYAVYCCTGKLPQHVIDLLNQDSMTSAILCALDTIGMLEPMAAQRPPACEPAIFWEQDITLAAATQDIVTGVITPSSARAISPCAPTNKALMLDKLRVTAGNLTASRQPVVMPVYKRVNMGGAGFGQWCLPFEPDSGAIGVFRNVEHLLVPPMAGFSVYVENHNPNSEAIYHVEARFWAAC